MKEIFNSNIWALEGKVMILYSSSQKEGHDGDQDDSSTGRSM